MSDDTNGGARGTPEQEQTFSDLMINREHLGRMVRLVWIAWAKEQPNPKSSWLSPWEELSESDREVDRRIGEALAEEGYGIMAAYAGRLERKLEAYRKRARKLYTAEEAGKRIAEHEDEMLKDDSELKLLREENAALVARAALADELAEALRGLIERCGRTEGQGFYDRVKPEMVAAELAVKRHAAAKEAR